MAVRPLSVPVPEFVTDIPAADGDTIPSVLVNAAALADNAISGLVGVVVTTKVTATVCGELPTPADAMLTVAL